MQFRQGDILIEKIDTMPKRKDLTEIRRKNGDLIVAEGEATGHHHKLVGGNVQLFERNEDELNGRVIVVDKPTSLVHDEHDTIDLPEGIFEVVGQREYGPKMPVRVYD